MTESPSAEVEMSQGTVFKETKRFVERPDRRYSGTVGSFILMRPRKS